MKKEETKPTVTIDLPPVLEAYCRWIFETARDEEAITVNRRHNVGKHLFSKVMRSDCPVSKKKAKKNPVTFILPSTDNAFAAFKRHFIYVDDFATMQIIDFIEAEFDFWLRHRFETGYKFGWSQDEIVNAILRGLNIRSNAANFDAIKKRDYRTRRKTEEKRFETLLQTEN